MIPPLRRVLLIVLAAATVLAGEGAAGARRYAVPGHGFLELRVPASWREEVAYPPADLPPTFEFSPATGSDFSVQVTPIWSPTGDPDFNHPETLRPLLGAIGAKQLDQSLESRITLVEMKGPHADGFSFTLTDRAPAPGEWKYQTQGAVGVGDLMVSFTILANRLDSDDRQAALDMIARSLQAPASSAPVPPAPPPQPSTLRKLTYPGKSWSLVLDLPGFSFERRATRPDMTGVDVFGSNDSTGVLISVFLDRADHAGGAMECRDFYQKKGRGHGLPRRTDVRTFERGEMALVEFTAEKFQGRAVHQRNVNAYLSHDGIWIDIHLSKLQFQPADQALFDAILDSARIQEIVAGAPAARPGATPDPAVQSFPVPGKDWLLTLDTLGADLKGSPSYDFDEKEGAVTGQKVVGWMIEASSPGSIALRRIRLSSTGS